MGSDCAKNCISAAISNSDPSRILSLPNLLIFSDHSPPANPLSIVLATAKTRVGTISLSCHVAATPFHPKVTGVMFIFSIWHRGKCGGPAGHRLPILMSAASTLGCGFWLPRLQNGKHRAITLSALDILHSREAHLGALLIFHHQFHVLPSQTPAPNSAIFAQSGASSTPTVSRDSPAMPKNQLRQPFTN